MAVVPSGGKNALTRWNKIERFQSGFSLLSISIHTGRTHQIRVHAVHLDMPLVGDKKYASPDRQKHWKKKGAKRLFLHAQQLKFRTLDGTEQLVTSQLPDDLKTFMDSLL